MADWESDDGTLLKLHASPATVTFKVEGDSFTVNLTASRLPAFVDVTAYLTEDQRVVLTEWLQRLPPNCACGVVGSHPLTMRCSGTAPA